MPNYDDDTVVLPDGLTDKMDESFVNGRDRYKLISDEDVRQAGSVVEGFNYPVVQVPSATELASHGGSMGFDASRPFAVLMDRKNHAFVMDDISKMPPELINYVSKEAEKEIMNGGAQANPGRVLARVLRKHLASTHIDGPALDHLSTWVNDGHDPFRQEVKLPPPVALHATIKKGRNMHPSHRPNQPPGYFASPSPIGNHNTPMHPAMTPHGHAQTGHSTGFPPGTPMAGNQHYPANTRQNMPAPTQPMQSPMSQVPAPSQLVMFQLPGGTIKSRYHVAKLIDQECVFDGMPVVLQYILLVRNNAAVGTDDNFVPTTPSPNAELWVTMPDSTSHKIHSVAVSYDIKTTNHTLLLVSPPPPQPADVNGTGDQNYFDANIDPMGQLGETAPFMSEEDAASAM